MAELQPSSVHWWRGDNGEEGVPSEAGDIWLASAGVPPPERRQAGVARLDELGRLIARKVACSRKARGEYGATEEGPSELWSLL